MTQAPTTDQAPPDEVPADPPSAVRRLVAVDRAVAEFRHARPVTILAEDGAMIALAAEGSSDEAMERLKSWASGEAALALSAKRAAVLHIGPTGFDPVLLPLASRLTAASVHDLIDPIADLERPWQGPYTRIKAAPPEAAVAAVILAKRALLLPAAIVAPVADGLSVARARDLVLVAAADARAAGDAAAATLRPVTSAQVALRGAESARIHAFRPADGGVEHLAIVIGEPARDRPVLTRLHSECFTGDLLGSLRCDCGEQLRGAIDLIGKAGAGVLLYLAQEGRGIGLINKLRSYRLQDLGFDTIEANWRLGFEADERLFGPAAEMLKQLGYTSVRLLTNNPDKVEGLARMGIEVVERVGHAFPSNNHNEAYLAAKKRRSGHYL